MAAYSWELLASCRDHLRELSQPVVQVKSASMLPNITPVIPVRRRDLFESAEWLYELKHDGFRALAYLGDAVAGLFLGVEIEMKRFADLAALIAKQLKVKYAVFDGEIVVARRQWQVCFL